MPESRGVCEGGGGRLLEQALRSYTSLLMVAYITLPETRPDDVVSMHECYTYFLLMFRKDGKCFFACFMHNDIKSGKRVVGERGRDEVGLVRASGKGAHEAVSFRRRHFRVFRKRRTVRTAGTTNV